MEIPLPSFIFFFYQGKREMCLKVLFHQIQKISETIADTLSWIYKYLFEIFVPTTSIFFYYLIILMLFLSVYNAAVQP